MSPGLLFAVICVVVFIWWFVTEPKRAVERTIGQRRDYDKYMQDRIDNGR